MTSFTWCKLYHDFADDTKFLRVADLTGATVELVQACFARAICRGSASADRGSIADIDFEEFAWWFKKPVELIQSIFACFERVGRMIKDGRLANWAKRQGAAVERVAQTVVSAGALRVRRYRKKKAEAAREPEIPGLATSVTLTVTSTAEEKGYAQNQTLSTKTLNTESVAASEGSFESDRAGSRRDAPFVEPEAPSNIVKLENSAAVKAKKKEARRQKVMRFLLATYVGEELDRRMNGMLGVDETRDDQWWFDKCDAERKLANWDDKRDREPSGWQRVG